MYIICYNNKYTWALGSLQSKGHTVLGTRTPSPRAARRAIAAAHKRELDHIAVRLPGLQAQAQLGASGPEQARSEDDPFGSGRIRERPAERALALLAGARGGEQEIGEPRIHPRRLAIRLYAGAAVVQ